MLDASERDTAVVGRSVRDSSRVLRNRLVEQVLEAERSASQSYKELFPLIGAERWMDASARGDADDGAYPVGLAVALINELPTVQEVVTRIVAEAEAVIRGRLGGMLTAP